MSYANKLKNIPYIDVMTDEELEALSSTKILTLGWRWKHIHPFLKHKQEKDDVMEMLLSPVRNILKYKKVSDYLKKHKVIISLTTSPKRLKSIYAVLCTLDIENVNEINIVLPKTYGSKKEKYNQKDINYCKKFPKVKVIRTSIDYGPITKMLPTIEKAKAKDIIISIDDDVCYPMGMVNEMIYSKIVRYPNHTISSPMEGFQMRKYIKNFKNMWPTKDYKRSPYIDIVEGWSGIAYDKCSANTEMMKKFAGISKHCYLSDDLVISYVLESSGIKKVAVNNDYTFAPYPYEFGTGDDALHKGGGADVKPSGIGDHDDSYNFQKYSICLEDIKRITKCPHCSIKDYQEDVYKLLEHFKRICEKQNIIYWATFSTLLGAYRDYKLIDWEDHIDVGMVKEDIEILKNIKGDFDLFYENKVYYFQQKSISNKYYKKDIPEPYIQIFEYKVKENDKTIKSTIHNKYPKNFFLDNQLFPLKQYKFGTQNILGPNEPKYYLKRMYNKWETPVKTVDNPYFI